MESVELEAEVDKENVTFGVFDTESSMLDEILSVESGGSTTRLHGSSDSDGQQHKEVNITCSGI